MATDGGEVRSLGAPTPRIDGFEPRQGFGAYRIKGIGENSNSQTAPATANAIEDAVGLRIRNLPVNAERVFQALRA